MLMEPDGGGWIRAESLGGEESLGRDDGWPEAGSPEDGCPEDDCPEDGSPAAAAPAAAAAAPGKGWGHGGVPGFSGWVAAAVAVVAAAAGVAVGLLVIRGTPPVSAAGAAAPSVSAAAPSAPASAGTLRIFLTGRVLAVSR